MRIRSAGEAKLRWSLTDGPRIGARDGKDDWEGVDRTDAGDFDERSMPDWHVIGLLLGYVALLAIGITLAF